MFRNIHTKGPPVWSAFKGLELYPNINPNIIPYRTHYSSFHFIFHYPNINPNISLEFRVEGLGDSRSTFSPSDVICNCDLLGGYTDAGCGCARDQLNTNSALEGFGNELQFLNQKQHRCHRENRRNE